MLLLFSLFFLFPGPAIASSSSAEEPPQLEISSETDIHNLLSSLSDEQVRRLLIEELKKDTTTPSEALPKPGGGPGEFLNEMLSSLEGASTNTEGRAKTLFQQLPTVFPDLYKVFITL